MKRKLTGSDKDPLFYLGIISVILIALAFCLPVPARGIPALSLPHPSPTGVNESSSVLSIGPLVRTFELPDAFLIQKNSLKAVFPPLTLNPQLLATLSEMTEEVDVNRGGIIEYAVQEGDTVSSIAEKFSISLETVLWANNLNKTTILTTGKKLVILPVSGVVHQVKTGEALGDIVKKYKGNLDETIVFNDLENENQVFAGDLVIVPNGIMPVVIVPAAPAPVRLAPLVAGYFICPISAPCRITQRLHWYNAVDLGHSKCWEPVFAAAGGTIQKAKSTTSASKWAFGGAGNHITILHPNGVVTFYGHLASLAVSSGDSVSQGQIIGYVGGARYMAGSGNSTGCHLHFQITGAQNPFAY